MAKGYRLVITHFLGLPAKCNNLALASPQPHTAFACSPMKWVITKLIHIIVLHPQQMLSIMITVYKQFKVSYLFKPVLPLNMLLDQSYI